MARLSAQRNFDPHRRFAGRGDTVSLPGDRQGQFYQPALFQQLRNRHLARRHCSFVPHRLENDALSVAGDVR